MSLENLIHSEVTRQIASFAAKHGVYPNTVLMPIAVYSELACGGIRLKPMTEDEIKKYGKYDTYMGLRIIKTLEQSQIHVCLCQHMD